MIPGTVTDMCGSFVDSQIGTLVMKEGIARLQEQTFLKSHIGEIVFPHSLKYLKSSVFLDVENLKCLKLYTGLIFTKFGSGFGYQAETPFWFNTDYSFNDLEMVELYDEKEHLIARMGVPAANESRAVYEFAHYYLDRFLQVGTALKTDIEPGRYSDYSELYKGLKKKDSKVRLLYGVLSMPEIEEKKWIKDFLPEIKKYRKAILQLAENNDDITTIEIANKLIQ